MKVELLAYTSAADFLCGTAAAICTRYIGDRTMALRGAMESGHESVLEHAAFTFRIEGVSRALLAQLTRHRIASYSVESQRYVDIGGENGYIVPPSIDKKEDFREEYTKLMNEIMGFYRRAVKAGIPKEDARYITPQAMTTNLIVTMNARELRHFFNLRCCTRAQWEIRRLACMMLKQAKEAAPLLFKDAGASCAKDGKCPEGKKSCGRPWKVVNEEQEAKGDDKKHGKWLSVQNTPGVAECSECKAWSSKRYKHCPECLAEMYVG